MILQEDETEGQVRIDAAYGRAYAARELHRRSHCGTHAEADRRRPLGPSPDCATGRYTIGWIPSRCESNTASSTTPTIVRSTSGRERGCGIVSPTGEVPGMNARTNASFTIDDWRRTGRIAHREVAAGPEGGAVHGEPSWRDEVEGDATLRVAHPHAAVDRRPDRAAGVRHARHARAASRIR